MGLIFFNSNQQNLPDITSSKEQWLIHRNGQKLFDTWLGAGTLIFGHEGKSEITIDMLPQGAEIDSSLIGLFQQLVDFEIGGIGFQTSGSSAVTRAIRLARAITNRDRIAVIGGFWHGSEDEVLFKEHKNRLSTGIPTCYQQKIEWFSSFEEFFKKDNIDRFAGVLVEPYQGSNPSISMLENFNYYSRERLRENGILLLCDEVITGFREQYGSCKSSRSAEPDIVIFGKTAALGFPIGIVLVEKEIISKINDLPFWGGTASASPTQLSYLKNSFSRLSNLDYSIIKKNQSDLRIILDPIVHEAGFEIKSGCLFSRILYKEKKNHSRAFISADNNYKLLQNKLLNLGFYIGNNALLFPSIYNPNNSE